MVPLKMLPFDNKNEFQLVLDFPEGTTLEATDRAVREFERLPGRGARGNRLRELIYGHFLAHGFQRLGAALLPASRPGTWPTSASIWPTRNARQQSHEIVLRLRNDLEAIAEANGALKIVEVPPGPPVLSSTLVAEIEVTRT
jgi:multidrug efflux pump subunit AcrB